MPITWDAEKDHKILLYLLKRNIETKDIDVNNLASLFEGATPEALRQHINKLRRESKLTNDGPENSILSSDTNNPTPTTTATTNIKNGSSPANSSPAKSRGRPKKSANAKNGKDDVANGGPVANGKGGKTGGAGGKRKRGVSAKVVEEEGYRGDIEEEEEVEVKKVKTESEEVEGGVDGEKGVGAGEEKEMVEMAFMMEEEEGEGEGGEGGMIEA